MLASKISSLINPYFAPRVNGRVIDFTDEQDIELATNLEQHVRKLVQFERYIGNQKGLDAAGDYIKERWESMGLKVEEPTNFRGPQNHPKFPDDSTIYRNLVVSFGPKNGRRIILGAHYDVEGKNNPGADDNGSGAAGLIEATRILKKLNLKLKRRIDMVAFTTEEEPYYHTELMGSAVYARFLKKNRIPVDGAVILEMIGYFSDKPDSQRWPVEIVKHLLPTTGNFIQVVGNGRSAKLVAEIGESIKENSKLPVECVSLPFLFSLLPDTNRSDHVNFIPGVMVTDTADFRYDYYHDKEDLPDRLDYKSMAEVVKGVCGGLVNLAS